VTWAFLVDSVVFTKAVRDGETSLGGSESACLGLARALKARGHDVHIYTTQLAQDAVGPDAAGCVWHPADDFRGMNEFFEWDVVVALRWFGFFSQFPVHARLRLLWNQDLLVPGQMVQGVMSVGWAIDQFVYVSEYHQAQWEDLEPCVAGHGWVTKNGFDPTHLPRYATKDPNRIIHISRPERGLKPLLAMWPALKAKHPQATLQLCRYSSMYDDGGWGEVCRQFDRNVQAVNQKVGGIEYLGELNKPDLYQAISDAAVMWYPGVSTFAETSCIAAIEAQACGTPFVGSLKGALPETARPSYDAGLLIPGDAEHDAAYHEASITAVLAQLDGCARQSFAYRALQRAGKKHVESYTYETLAEQWDAHVEDLFKTRYEANKIRVMRQLLHEDDHVAALLVADEITQAPGVASEQMESFKAAEFCEYVIAGKDHTAEQYGAAAIPDPLREIELSGRFKASGRCSMAAPTCWTWPAGTARLPSGSRSTIRRSRSTGSITRRPTSIARKRRRSEWAWPTAARSNAMSRSTTSTRRRCTRIPPVAHA
jgi:glycosyltransferase involved in cell wall biosynthesis